LSLSLGGGRGKGQGDLGWDVPGRAGGVSGSGTRRDFGTCWGFLACGTPPAGWCGHPQGWGVPGGDSHADRGGAAVGLPGR
jgi:hypothetical protein